MKKKYSLKRNEEIAKIVRRRVFVRNDTFIIYYKNNTNNEHSRICISVGKKNGIAVVRNKIKRQIRAMVDEVFVLNENTDYVIIIKPLFSEKSFSENKERLKELYLKIKSRNKEC